MYSEPCWEVAFGASVMPNCRALPDLTVKFIATVLGEVGISVANCVSDSVGEGTWRGQCG